jgi:hypothetical protein
MFAAMGSHIATGRTSQRARGDSSQHHLRRPGRIFPTVARPQAPVRLTVNTNIANYIIGPSSPADLGSKFGPRTFTAFVRGSVRHCYQDTRSPRSTLILPLP